MLQGRDVTLGQVDDMDEVPLAGPIGGFEGLCAGASKDRQLVPGPHCHLGEEGHEVVRDPLRVLPNPTRRVGGHGVEVSQDGQRPFVVVLVGLVQIAEHLFDHIFGAAIGAGDAATHFTVLGVRDGSAAIDRGGGGEHQLPAVVLFHALEQVEGGGQIVLIVGHGLGHRLSNGLEAREVDDGMAGTTVGENLVQSVQIAQVHLEEVNHVWLACDVLDTVDSLLG
mmetsp:Transcript_33923/g.60852  ORF Transcript_33923/g.60852 Transcript_33923/m.60852 type:complete len:224 (-) Transcript_33923:132-803(-)